MGQKQGRERLLTQPTISMHDTHSGPYDSSSKGHSRNSSADGQQEFELDRNLPSDMLYSSDRNKVTLDDFELLKLIGRGNFAKVMQVRKKDSGLVYAIKILNKRKLEQADQLEHIRTERAILQYVEHPFLIKLVYAFQTMEKLYMVMEFVNGGELFFHLKQERRFSESRVKFYAAELFLGIEHLHNQNIVFRDLKPENVLMDRNGHIMLTDFGLAKYLLKQDRTHTFCGTPEYLAPEVLLQRGHGKPVDWWSYGILIYEMLVGIPPFYSDNVQDMYNKILHSDLLLSDQLMTQEVQDLLIRLLERDPRKRLGSGPKGTSEIKNHPFFRGIDWQDVYDKKVVPSFRPKVRSELDTCYFDEEFTRQDAIDSIGDPSYLGASAQKAFEGFTFNSNGRHLRIDSGDRIL
ncbi:glucocorticoid-regulated kinase [Acrasis kona]|uniref:Glucocorticoid-regulated kinase n=1 Tax=Acrasis kona TaxID=1008807 RepID=A0AAW2Z7E2_9EUKA